ncbi:hypothetical protein [Paraburkholderia heleia]|uniref:hypothetical protein n=1 Tax=Paraburkholderia heleia TaxID=634127 RepID=UPI002AB66082|nr:hypothetical protein [Paraburkholderia heleia]
MQAPSHKEIAANPLIGDLRAYSETLQELYVRHPHIDAAIDQARSCLTAGTGLPDICAIYPFETCTSWLVRYARVNSRNKEVAASHQPVAADTIEKMGHHRKSVRSEYLARYAEPETDFQACLEKLWAAAERGRKCALADHFRLPQGGYLPMGVLWDQFVSLQRGETAHATGNSALALCRQWADLDRYSALQAHFDACDAQLS